MSNEDILLTVKVGKLDSKEATDKLHKELNSIMGKLKVGYSQQDLDKMVSDLAKVAKKASVEMAVYVKNALTKSVQNVFSFDKKGNLTDTLPSNIWKEWSKTIKFTPKTFSPSGASKGLVGEDFTEAFSKPLAELAQELGATKTAIKKIRENLPAALSGIKYEQGKNGTGKVVGSIELGKGLKANVAFGAQYSDGQLSPLRDQSGKVSEIGVTGIDYTASSYGKKYFDKAVTAQKLIPGLKEAVSNINEQMGTLTKGSEKYSALMERRVTLQKEIRKLQRDINKAEKESTAAQKGRLSQIQKVQDVKKQEKEATEQIKASQKEQNNAYKDSLSLLSQIDKLTKQNIQYSDSSKSKELVNINNVKLESLRKEYELKKAMLSPEDKSKLAAKEKAKFTEQNMKAVEKTLKLQSTKGSRGNFKDETRTAISRVATYGMAYKSIGYLQNAIKGTLDKLIEFDKYMTSLQIVTRENDAETKKLLASYIQLGKEVGASTQQVVEAADTWLRQGRSVADTNELIRATMVMANIAQIDSAKSADILTSALNGFKLEAKDAMSVVDMFAAVDLAAAADTEELAEALQRVAATAGEAGLSIETTTSYIGTLLDATRLDAGSIKKQVA